MLNKTLIILSCCGGFTACVQASVDKPTTQDRTSQDSLNLLKEFLLLCPNYVNTAINSVRADSLLAGPVIDSYNLGNIDLQTYNNLVNSISAGSFIGAFMSFLPSSLLPLVYEVIKNSDSYKDLSQEAKDKLEYAYKGGRWAAFGTSAGLLLINIGTLFGISGAAAVTAGSIVTIVIGGVSIPISWPVAVAMGLGGLAGAVYAYCK